MIEAKVHKAIYKDSFCLKPHVCWVLPSTDCLLFSIKWTYVQKKSCYL